MLLQSAVSAIVQGSNSCSVVYTALRINLRSLWTVTHDDKTCTKSKFLFLYCSANIFLI